jgi:hypothetical protein
MTVATVLCLLCVGSLFALYTDVRHAALPWLAFALFVVPTSGTVVGALLIRGGFSYACEQLGYPASLGPKLRQLQKDSQRQGMLARAQKRDTELAARMAATARFGGG